MELQHVIVVRIYWVQLVTFPYTYYYIRFTTAKEKQGMFLSITFNCHFEKYMMWTDVEKSSKSGSHTEFLSGETLPENPRSLYVAGKSCSNPCTLE